MAIEHIPDQNKMVFSQIFRRSSTLIHSFLCKNNGYYLVMTNSSPWKIHPCLNSVNHLFLWAIYAMAMLNNQMVHPHDHALMTIPRYVFFHQNLLTMKGSASILEDLSEKIGFHCFIVKKGFRENLQEPDI